MSNSSVYSSSTGAPSLHPSQSDMTKDPKPSILVPGSTTGPPHVSRKPILPAPATCQTTSSGAANSDLQLKSSAEVDTGQIQAPASPGPGGIASCAVPAGNGSTVWTAHKPQPPWGFGAADPTSKPSYSSTGVIYQDPGVCSQMGGTFPAQQGPAGAPSTLSQTDVGLPPGVNPDGGPHIRRHVLEALNHPALRGLDIVERRRRSQ
ncbi:hypothetical protein Tdes44962_MAKER04544 [Teratosphaeria destructans]|uniref:Uncharacterized protein n=1 Tax=Teratosphaeria destructans TaxID=418781 RepID=A0A9W7VZT0_9PEZI|nr:hypothetical protein Tdes44962_MAKER04544 [Teratosphaeria destructans]